MFEELVASQEWFFKSKEERDKERKEKAIAAAKERAKKWLQWFDAEAAKLNHPDFGVPVLLKKVAVIATELKNKKPSTAGMSNADLAVLDGWSEYAIVRSAIEKAPMLLSIIKTISNRTRTCDKSHSDWWSGVEDALIAVDRAKAYCIKYGTDFFEITPWYEDESYKDSKDLLNGTSSGGYTKDNFIRLTISAAPMLAGVLKSFADMRAVVVAYGDDMIKALEADKEQPVENAVIEDMVNGIWSSMKAVHLTMRDSVSLSGKMVEKWY